MTTKGIVMQLSPTERWILSLQFTILAKLYPDEREYYEILREAVDNGYELDYRDMAHYILTGDQAMTVNECKEVINILDMFSFMKDGYKKLSDKSGIDDVWVKFHGFDGNTESKYLGYTRFLIEREHKFIDLDRGDNFNSHMPILDIYRRMLREWEKCPDKYNLSKDDIIRITSASAIKQ